MQVGSRQEAVTKSKVVRRQLAVFSFLTADFGDDTGSYKALGVSRKFRVGSRQLAF